LLWEDEKDLIESFWQNGSYWSLDKTTVWIAGTESKVSSSEGNEQKSDRNLGLLGSLLSSSEKDLEKNISAIFSNLISNIYMSPKRFKNKNSYSQF
jgi:hypothetical protein